jgi:hypothetical protein
MIDLRIDRLFADLIAQWNIAERRIKKAEQVGGEEAVASAIFELRYAGRKVIDCLHLLLDKDLGDPNIYELICRNLAESIEDCVKAKHDSIDAMVDFITIWFDELEKRIGTTEMVRIFPEYLGVVSRIAIIQDNIVESRGNRLSNNRDSVYDNVENDDYEKLLKLFNKMKTSQDRVQAIIDTESRTKRRDFWLLVIGAGAGVLTLIAVVGFETYKLLSSAH